MKVKMKKRVYGYIHPKAKRKFRQQYQNLSMSGKLKWHDEIREMRANQQKTGLYREDGSLDLIKVASRAQRIRGTL